LVDGLSRIAAERAGSGERRCNVSRWLAVLLVVCACAKSARARKSAAQLKIMSTHAGGV
jgi:hypothetical protein